MITPKLLLLLLVSEMRKQFNGNLQKIFEEGVTTWVGHPTSTSTSSFGICGEVVVEKYLQRALGRVTMGEASQPLLVPYFYYFYFYLPQPRGSSRKVALPSDGRRESLHQPTARAFLGAGGETVMGDEPSADRAHGVTVDAATKSPAQWPTTPCTALCPRWLPSTIASEAPRREERRVGGRGRSASPRPRPRGATSAKPVRCVHGGCAPYPTRYLPRSPSSSLRAGGCCR